MIAKTVSKVVNLKDSCSKAILDRRFNIDIDFIEKVINKSTMGWEGRKPKSVTNKKGEIIYSDLDLLSWLVPLALRGAVIEIPNYTNKRISTTTEGERKVGQKRFGKITGLVSNKDMYSFSVQITDYNVIGKDLLTEKEQIGKTRRFMLVDIDGNLRDFGKKLLFSPTAKENAFLFNKNLMINNEMSFRYVVHPNRWRSVFSSQHLLKKMLLARINDEAKFYRLEIARLKNEGFYLSDVKKTIKEIGLTNKIKLATMEMALKMPKFIGKYKTVANNLEGLKFATDRYKWLIYNIRPLVQFAIRANELAYFKFGGVLTKNEKIAHWLGDLNWETKSKNFHYKNKWNYLALGNGFTLRYRLKNILTDIAV
jgi:hypothetical protein